MLAEQTVTDSDFKGMHDAVTTQPNPHRSFIPGRVHLTDCRCDQSAGQHSGFDMSFDSGHVDDSKFYDFNQGAANLDDELGTVSSAGN